MIGRVLLAALLALSVWTAAGRAVDTALPSLVANAGGAAACVDVPQPRDSSEHPHAVLRGHGASPASAAWKIPPRLAAFPIAPAAASSRVSLDRLARPGPTPDPVSHLHAIPLLI